MVRALIQDPDSAIFVGTEGDGAFASFDEGATWQPANEGLVATGIFSLAVDAQGHVVGGTSSGVFRATINRPRR
jgi:ligand-binding sensor domain-containing protein